MMIKISELKKLGVEVAVGDLLSNGNVINDDWKNILNHFDVEDFYVTEFAPRENSGECPVNGDVMVEATLESGEVVDRHAIDFIWKDIDDGGLIVSWIPSIKHLVGEISGHIASIPFSQKGVVIERVEAAITTLTGMDYTFNGGTHWKPPLGVKPVFTKAMADAGELPPVGSECILDIDKDALVSSNSISYSGEVVLILAHHQKLAICVLKNNDSYGWAGKFNISAFLPLPTKRDVITDDIENIIVSHGFLNKDNITEQMANLIYNAGYRKSDK